MNIFGCMFSKIVIDSTSTTKSRSGFANEHKTWSTLSQQGQTRHAVMVLVMIA